MRKIPEGENSACLRARSELPGKQRKLRCESFPLPGTVLAVPPPGPARHMPPHSLHFWSWMLKEAKPFPPYSILVPGAEDRSSFSTWCWRRGAKIMDMGVVIGAEQPWARDRETCKHTRGRAYFDIQSRSQMIVSSCFIIKMLSLAYCK